jgi:pimeloyl-ACP methyl ester carboxylesterase
MLTMSGMVTVDGLEIGYEVWGADGAPAMVLLHGLGDDGRSWSAVGPALAATHRVYAPDLRGHGRSGRPGRYSLEAMRDDVIGFLNALGVTRTVLIGHSMGGTVAWLLAEDHPDRVTALVSVDSPVPHEPMPRPAPARPEHPVPFDWAVVESVFAQLTEPDPAWWDRLGRVHVPVLLIGGGPTSSVSQALLEATAAEVPGSRIVTLSGGHHVHRERPATFVAAVHDFLAGSRTP